MIDIQTYRTRIGSAPGIVSKILQRKATASRSETQHEDIDLLKKSLKTVTIFQFSYFLLILLVITLTVSKYAAHTSFLRAEFIHHTLQYSYDWSHIREGADAFLTEGTFAILCTGLCLCNIGTVHFISILLLMAGIEPNPGPTSGTEKTKSNEKSQVDEERSNICQIAKSDISTSTRSLQVNSTTCVQNQNAQVKDAEAQCDDHADGDVTLPMDKRHVDDDAIDSPEDHQPTNSGAKPKKKSVFSTLRRKLTKSSKSKSTSISDPAKDRDSYLDMSRRTIEYIQEVNDDTFIEENIDSVFIKKEDNTVALCLRNMDITSETFDMILSKIDLPIYDISEVDLSYSTFCSQSWAEHPDGYATLKTLLKHSRLQYLRTVNLDIAKFSEHQKGGLLISLKHKKLTVPDLKLLHRLLTSVMSHFEVSCIDIQRSAICRQSWGELPDGPQLLDDLLRHLRLQGASVVKLDYVGLTTVPKSIAESHHHCLTELSIRNNELTTIGNSLATCRCLVELNLSVNRLVELPDTFDFPNLEILNLERNPMYEIPAVLAQLPSLKIAMIGAPETRTVNREFVGHSMKTNCDIQIDADNLDKLKAPTFKQLTKNPEKYVMTYDQAVAQLQDSLSVRETIDPVRLLEGTEDTENGETPDTDVTKLAGEIYTLYLTCVEESKDSDSILNMKGVLPMTSQRAFALIWILKSEKYKFKELVMAGQADFYQLLGSENFQTFLELEAFHPLQRIALDKCGLGNFPRCDHFKTLDTIDISDNNLTFLPDFSLSTLRQLRLEGNPLPKVDIDPKNVPNLELLSLGSNQTEIIGGRLLERCCNNFRFSIEVDPEYRDYLIVPLVTPLYTGPLRFGTVGSSVASSSDQSETQNSSVSFSSLKSLRRMSLPAALTRFNPRKSSSDVAAPVRRSSSRSAQRRMSLFAKSEKSSKSYLRLSDIRDSVQKTLDVSYYFWKVKAEMDFRSIESVESRFRAGVYVLEEVNCSKHQHALTLTSQSDLYEFLGPERFDEFLRHDKLTHLNYLSLDNCNLPKIPDLSKLTELRYLNVSGNHIKDIDETVTKLRHLHDLDISRNPVENINENINNCSALESLNIEETQIAMLHLDFTNGKLSKLSVVQCGSEYLKYISHATLNRKQNKEKELKLEILEQYRPTLTVPNYKTLSDRSLLHEFLEKQSLTDILNNDLTRNEYYEALMSLLNQGDQLFTVIDLTGRDLGSERLQVIINNKNSSCLTQLILGRSNLEVIPDLSNLINLEYLDVSNNSITTLKGLESKNLKTLVADGNTFSVLDFEPDKVPSLTEVSFGSERCEFVSFPIIDKSSTGTLKLRLSDEGRKHLMIPPPEFLDYAQELEAYVQDTEISLSQFNTSDPEKQYKCLSWMIEHKHVEYDTLNLASEVTFCTSVGQTRLQGLISGMKTLVRLNLSGCQLEAIPDIKDLAQLKVLNLAENNISSFENIVSESVEEVNLQDNPVRGFDLDTKSLPSLHSLTIGSPQTKYLSLNVLSKVKEGLLRLDLANQHMKNLVFPPADCITDKSCLVEFVENPSLDLTNIAITERKDAFNWALAHCGSKLKSLKISSQEDPIVYSIEDVRSDLLAIFEKEKSVLGELRYLYMSNLGLKSLPDLSASNNLLKVDFSHNDIETIDNENAFVNNSLLELDLSMNPIVAFNTKLNNFPALEKLHLGAPQTKYLCYPLLDRMVSKLEVSFHESCKTSLLYPTSGVANDRGALKKLIDRKELSLQNIENICDKAEAFNWLLKQCGIDFKSLSLSGEQKFLLETDVNLSECFEKVASLHSLRKIGLNSCGLKSIPKLTSLEQLELVDLSHNMIEELDMNSFPKSVRKIDTEGNPIQYVDIDCVRFADLNELKCGSESTHYITSPTVRSMHRGCLDVAVPENYRKHLYMPPEIVLDNRDHLKNYVEHPEKYLAQVDIEHRSEALQWLFLSSQSDLSNLDFSLQDWLFRVDLSCINLQNVHSLKLDSCGLIIWPNLNAMSGLTHLSLCNNNLENIRPSMTMTSLETLNVSNNPIQEIDFDTELFQKLTTLRFGSDVTSYISVRVLNQNVEGTLELDIPEERHRQSLLLPTWNTINEGRDSVNEYISCGTLGRNVLSIMDNENRWKALTWQLDKNEKTFTVLDLSGQAEFCNCIKQEGLPTMFRHDSVKFVTDINLSGCDLESVPEWNSLGNLKHADLSGNRLKTVPVSKTLERLDVSGCQMKVLSFSEQEFTNLREIKAGSPDLQYIAFKILRKVTISDNHQKSLIMPPPCVYAESKLDAYLKAPEKYLVHVDRKNLGHAVKWLFSDADFQFKEVDLSEEGDVFRLPKTEMPFLRGKNLCNVELLNASSCQLDNSIIPEFEHLTKLETLLISDNSLTDISTLKHPQLTSVYITGNPVSTVDINFEQCPKLTRINVGSFATQCLSVGMLERICLEKLFIDVEEKHKANIMLPPPDVVGNNFSKDEVEKYLNGGVFDLSWFESGLKKQGDDPFNVLLHILSMDKRTIRLFKMCDQPDVASKIGPQFDDLLKCQSLKSLERLVLCNCKMTHTPSYEHLNELTHIDLSGNQIGNDIDRLQKVLENMEKSSVIEFNLNNVRLTTIPNFSKLRHLERLDVSNNEITTLTDLGNKNLKTLVADGNLFPVLDFEPDKVPSLIEVSFGSEKCQFVSFPIIEKSSTGTLKLRLSDAGKPHLTVPPPSILENAQELQTYHQNREIKLSQFNTHPEKLYDCILWSLEHKPVQPDNLNLSGETAFCKSIGEARLTSLISRMITITTLNIAGCELDRIPDISSLSELKVLNLAENNISDFDNVVNESVEEVNLKANPLPSFDLDTASLPSLKCLKIGSSKTKYLSLNVLGKVKAGALKVEIAKQYLNTLVYPTANCLSDKESLEKFVDVASLDLTAISIEERKDAFIWALRNYGSMLKSLRLSSLCEEEIHSADVFTILTPEIGRLSKLTHLYMSDLGLTSIPDLSMADSLIVVDCSHNRIESTKDVKLPSNLRTLHLEGNPIKSVALSSTTLEQLAELYCGTDQLNYCIAIPIIDKVCKGQLKLELGDENRKSLLMPPEKILKEDSRDSLEEYIRSPERCLCEVQSVETKMEALEWLLCEGGREFTSLDLSGMDWIFAEGNDTRFADLVEKAAKSPLSAIQHLLEVNVSQCKIGKLEQIKCFQNIERLNVSSNNLTDISGVEMKQLRILDISDNPVETVDFQCESFPKLELLVCGSEDIRFISTRVLSLCCRRDFRVYVSEAYQEKLLMPPWQVINQNKSSVRRWIVDTELSLSHIKSDKLKLEALRWVTQRNEKIYTSLNLRKQASLFEIFGAEVCKILSNSVLSRVTKVYLNSCKLDSIEFLSEFEQLEYLDVSDNILRLIPECKKLKKINISGNDSLVNDFHALDVDLENCPDLCHLIVGSPRLKYVNFSILRTGCVEIAPCYEEHLILPPVEVLKDRKKLVSFLKAPETFVSTSGEPQAFAWLLNHSDHPFTTLNLSDQNLPVDSVPNYMSDLLSSGNVQNIDTLILVNCGLKELPNSEALNSLQTLNLDRNQIQSISSLTNSKLQSISMRGNPIPEISFTKVNCPALKYLSCGSSATEFIHINVLKLVAEKVLEIEMTEDSLKNILVPPSRMLENPETVKQYVHSNDFQMSWYRDKSDEESGDIMSTLQLVLDKERRMIQSFIMSGEVDLCTKIGLDGLEKLLKNTALQNISKVVLDGCDLNEIPNLVTLNKLKHLDMSENQKLGFQIANRPLNVSKGLKTLILKNCDLEQLPLHCLGYIEDLDVSYNKIKSIKGKFTAKHLKRLQIEGNPVSELEIKPNTFPSLERIEVGESKFGSRDIQYIGFELLRQLDMAQGNSGLELAIVGGGVPNLTFPPEHILTDGKLTDFIKRPYSYIREVGSRDLKARVLVWLLKNYGDTFQEFNCEDFEDVIRNLTVEQLEDLINDHESLHSVEKLDLSNCALKRCPSLRSLRDLRELTLDNNEITVLSGLDHNQNLQRLSIVNNPIQAVDVSMDSLKRISLGSDHTKFVGLSLLNAKLKGQLEINVEEPNRKHLLVPRHSVFQSNTELDAFLKSPLQEILNIRESTQRREAMVWMFTTNQHTFTELDLSNQGDVFGTMAGESFASILESDCLQNLKYLSLKNCDLNKFPKFQIPKSLEILDISDNYLGTFELGAASESELRQIIITGNPIERIEMDVANLPHLKVMDCGSVATKYISIPILERCMNGLILDIPVQYRNSLLLPSFNIIEDGRIPEFIANPENYSDQISDLSERINVLMWLLSSRKDQESFRLTSQKDLCMEESQLTKLLHEPNLAKIKKLFLDKCGLSFLPNLKHLSSLEVLDISYNAISDRSMNYNNLPSSLKELHIAGNPVEIITIDAEVLHSWKIKENRDKPMLIRCGSEHTKFISFALLDLVQNDELHIEVELDFKDVLLMPSFAVLTSADLGDYIARPDLYLNDVRDAKDMKDILDWLFKTEGKEFHTTFALSNPLCSELDIVSYFSDNAFKMVKTLSLKCQLPNPPNLSHLPKLTSHLVTLDLSGNNITDLSSNVCKLPCLETLKIENNPIELIDFDVKLLPCLKQLKCGSKELKYIRPALLKCLVAQKVNIEVSCEASNFLFPGRHYTKLGVDAISSLCENPEKAIDIGEVDIDSKINFLDWLLKEDLEFKSFSLCGHPELLNSQSDRNALHILANWKLYSIESLVLDGCNLKEFPNLKQFCKLEYLDLSDNNITNIPNLPPHNHLKTLILKGNPIETIDSDFDFFPALARLEIGSKKTHFLGMSLLERVAPEAPDSKLSKLSVIVSTDEQSLLMPHADLLKIGTPKEIRDYIQNPEQYIRKVPKSENKIKAVNWIVERYSHNFKKFDLSHRIPLCRALGPDGLNRIIGQLSNVMEIYLKGCDLTQAPQVASLSELRLLDLSFNKIIKVDDSFCHDKLTTLNLEANPIPNISLDRFPAVTVLTCGSQFTKSISNPTLERVQDGSLSITIAPNFRGSLQLPQYRVIAGGSLDIQIYLNKEELDIRTKEDIELYSQSLKPGEKTYKTLRMSKTSCTAEIIQSAEFQKTSDHLQSIESLFLPTCELQNFPPEFCFPKLTKVDLSNSNLLETVVSGLPETVNTLVARNCNLKELPGCPQLVSLDIRDNALTHLQSSAVFSKLKHLSIENNKLSVIDFDRTVFPEMNKLTCGSNECRFLSFTVVDEMIADRLCLDLTPGSNLYLPPRSSLNSEALQSYVKNPERYLDHLSPREAVDSLTWLLDAGKMFFTTFDLSGQVQLVDALGSGGLQEVLEKASLQNICTLSLASVNMRNMPNVTRLTKLNVLDLSCNRLTKLDNTFSHGTITELYVQGNPLPCLELNTNLLPELKYLRAGSLETHTIDKTILHRVLEGHLALDISDEFRSYLRFPTYDSIHNKDQLGRYFNTNELNLSTEEVGPMRFRLIEDRIKKFSNDITVLNLKGQTSIAENGEKGLNDLLGHQNLRNVKSLSLNSCNVKHFPNFKEMANLTYLDLGGNRFEGMYIGHSLRNLTTLCLKGCGLDRMFYLIHFPTLKELDISDNKIDSDRMRQFYEKGENKSGKIYPLEKLNVIGNPIEEVHINVKSFARLKELKIGSKITRYINFTLLKQAADGFLSIEVQEDCKKYLLLCPSKVLDDRTAIKNYIEDTEISLQYITKPLDRYNALIWLFKQKEKRVSTLNMSGHKEFFRFCKEKNIDLYSLFDNPKLKDVEIVYLDNCDLEEIPIYSKSLANLKVLYLSNNKLQEIQPRHKPIVFQSNESLQKLLIDGNPIETVHISNPLTNFPQLKLLQVGSERTHFLSSSVQEAAIRTENPLIVKVVDEYGKYMTTPPFEIIEAGPEKLRSFLQMKSEKTTSARYDMLENTTQNVLMFLGKPLGGKTSLLKSLRENEPIFTLQDERTIVLERGKLDLGYVTDLDRNLIISTYDFGAQDIYEIEYPVFLRGQNIIALIVIPLDECSAENHDELVTRWLQNCVLCADCKVLFVTSKSENYTGEEIEIKRQEIKDRILKYINDEIRCLEEEKLAIKNESSRKGEEDLGKIAHSLKFFEELRADVRVIAMNIYNADSLTELKEIVQSKVDFTRSDLPELFPRVINLIRSEGAKRRFHVTLDEVVKHFKNEYKHNKTLPGQAWAELKRVGGRIKQRIGLEDPTDYKEQIKTCLDYYHRKGWILWYDSCEKYIYVNVRNILKLHKKLYRHKEAMEELLTYDSDKVHCLDETKFNEHKNLLLQSGVMSSEILTYLWAEFNLTPEEYDGMIQLLLVNDHCFVDNSTEYATNDSKTLRFPWFIKKEGLERNFWVSEWPEEIPYDHIEFHLNYGFRRLPSTVYERISVRLQHVLKQNCNRMDWADGVYVQNGLMKLLMQRRIDPDLKIQELSIKFRAPSKDMSLLWDWCLNIYTNVLKKVIGQTKVVPYKRKAFVCPHCILSGCSFDDSKHRELCVVMESSCDHQMEAMCGTTVIPAAYVFPLLKGNEDEKKHIETVQENIRRLQRNNRKRDGLIPDYVVNDLAKRLSNKDIIWTVGLKLGLEHHIIETYYENNKQQVNPAAYQVLNHWIEDCIKNNDTVDSIKERIGDALKSANMVKVAEEFGFIEAAVEGQPVTYTNPQTGLRVTEV